ncbi:MAG TPA: hypothetical protein VFR87_04225 [Nocardioidaceae bacterium]|nr:hypothetical protein [Nocardioidaceae bacterium]
MQARHKRTRRLRNRLAAVLAATGVAALVAGSVVMGTVGTAQANDNGGPPDSTGQPEDVGQPDGAGKPEDVGKPDDVGQTWWFVCKYVGTPGVDERLQPSGENPIRVAANAIEGWQDGVSVGDSFEDGQGRSRVIAQDTTPNDRTDEPGVDQCPSVTPPGTGSVSVVFVPDCLATNAWRITNSSSASVAVTYTGGTSAVTIAAGGTYDFTTGADVDSVTVSWGGGGTGMKPGSAHAASGADSTNCGGSQTVVPPKPAVVVDTVVGSDLDCEDEIVTTTTTTTTVDWVYDSASNTWVKGQPQVSTQQQVRDATAAECPAEVLPSESVDVCPNLAGVQEAVPADYSMVNGKCVKDTVEGFETEKPKPRPEPVLGDRPDAVPVAVPEALPTAVDAGFGPTGAVPQGSLLGQGLVGGGLLMLLMAGSMQMGRRERGAHES